MPTPAPATSPATTPSASRTTATSPGPTRVLSAGPTIAPVHSRPTHLTPRLRTDMPVPSTRTPNVQIRPLAKTIRHRRSRTDRGAITAEYAVLIVGVCGFGGAMVALLRSPAMQAVLKGIMNFGLKLAGVEGVHL